MRRSHDTARRIVKNAALITAAAATALWLSFKPLVSSAQELKSLQATTAGVVNKDSSNLQSRLMQYSDTIASIDCAVPGGLTHVGYALKLFHAIEARYSPLLLSGFVHSMFASGRSECYNKAMLGFDAARKRGIPAAIAFGRTGGGQHAILGLWDIYIDMNTGRIYDRKEDRFISFYFEASSPQMAAYVALENLGFILQDRGDFHGAIAMFGKAIALAPRAADAYLARGICYYMNGCDSLALADFYSALKIDPSNPTALFYIREIKNQGK
jgi:tetratricopeptide (TPR) repeat protein